MKKIIKILNIIINFKIYLKKPKQDNILVYDRASKAFAEALFKKKNFSIYDNRFESINIYIFFKTLIHHKLNKILTFKKNYKKIYFECVKPKIIFTSIDNNPGFYMLKDLYPNAIYISDQNGMRDNDFYESALNYFKLNKKKLKCDYFFLFGLDYLKKISKVIDAKFIVSGNTLNNFFQTKKTKVKDKNILFISSGFAFDHFEKDVNLIKNLLIFCKKNLYKITILARPYRNLNKKFYEKFKNENLKILEPKNRKDPYDFIGKYSIIVFNHSTLGYEALARGIKVASFGHNYINKDYNYKMSGPFWCQNRYNDMEYLLKKLINYSPNRWNKIHKKYSKKIIYFDSGNKKKYKLINSFFKKK